MEKCQIKESLVEKLGVFIEQKDQLAPVAARILSYIILKGKVGTTFEDLVNDLCASKSTISTHLNLLSNLKKIVYFTKSGDRKKYYTINQDSIIQSINEMTDSWLTQKELHLEIRDYKENRNASMTDDTTKFDLEFHDNYIQFLDEATESIIRLRTKLIEKSNKL